jgi:hypothetical protein
MVQDRAAPAAAEQSLAWSRPWRVLLAGAGTVLAGSLLLSLDGPVVTPVRLLLIAAGLIAGGWAVKRFLANTDPDDELDRRVETAGFVAVYGLCGLVGFLGMRDEWFSGRIFFAFFITASIVGSFVLLLPRLWRRLAITVLVLLHFGGIVVASASSPPSGGQSWLAEQLMVRVYRPYLYPLYLTNAYHFYAPDPGSAPMAWFRLEYADGSYRWLKFPERETSPTPIHYQRTMAMALYCSVPGPPPDIPTLQQLANRRKRAGDFADPKTFADVIPMRDDIPFTAQFGPPNPDSLKAIESAVRHVCRYYPNDRDPNVSVVKVKVYRVAIAIPYPQQVADGLDPRDDQFKRPFYLGEYDSDGKLLNDNDPFLYWEIPIDSLPVHAGDIQPKVVNQQ